MGGEDVKMIAIPRTDANLSAMVQLNPSWFTPLGTMEEAHWDVYGVSVAQPGAAECEAARSASR